MENRYVYSKASDVWSKSRPWIPTRLGDITDLITASDRQTLVYVSRLMAENWGPVTAITRQIPQYAVGTAWKPSSQSLDEDYQTTVETFVREQFWPIAVMNGVGSEMTPNIRRLALLLIRDGEYFILLTKRRTGFPAIQIIPSHRVGTREQENGLVPRGLYRGLPILDGVVRNRQGVPVAYHILGQTPDKDRYVSARSMIHRMVSDYPEAVRGYPMIAHGLNDARDSLQSHEWERFNMLWRSSRTVIEHNETGAKEEHPGDHFDDSTTSCEERKTQVAEIHGGTTQYFRAGTNSKLELLKHENPGQVYESYGNRMIRSICTGVPWPFSFVWEGHTRGGGTSERRDIEQARRTIESVQALITPDIRRVCGYAVSVAANLDLVPSNEDWFKWSFSKPPKLSIDDGRNINALLELHARGLVSDGDVLADLGKDEEDYWKRKFLKGAEKEQEFINAQERANIELDPRIKGVISVNEQLPQSDFVEP